jgi:hypothetical protein
MILANLAVFITGSCEPMECIDEHVGWLREGWAALYVVITNEAEDLSLRKDCRVFADRSIPKMKDEPGGDDITVKLPASRRRSQYARPPACVLRGSHAATLEDSGPAPGLHEERRRAGFPLKMQCPAQQLECFAGLFGESRNALPAANCPAVSLAQRPI